MPAMTQAWAHLAAAAALIAALTAAAAQEQTAPPQPVELKLSHSFAPAHPLHAAIADWAASVAQESQGTIAVKLHPDRQLGKAFDQYDLARSGAADIAIAVPGLQIGRFPLIAAAELPLLFANATGGTAALDAWYRASAAQEMPDVRFCLAFVHDPGTIHSVRRKVVVPADIRGLKIRSGQNTMAAFVTQLGSNSVRAADSELLDLMVRGVAQAAMLPWQSAIEAHTDQIARNHLDLPLYTTPFVMVMNKTRYAKLSDTQRAAIDSHCGTPWAERIASAWAQWERAGREAMAARRGHELHAATLAQVEQWRTAAAPLTATWAARVKRIGGDPDAALTALKAALAQHGAAF